MIKKFNLKKYGYILHSCVTIIFIAILFLTVRLGVNVFNRFLESMTVPFFIVLMNYCVICIINVGIVIQLIGNFKRVKR